MPQFHTNLPSLANLDGGAARGTRQVEKVRNGAGPPNLTDSLSLLTQGGGTGWHPHPQPPLQVAEQFPQPPVQLLQRMSGHDHEMMFGRLLSKLQQPIGKKSSRSGGRILTWAGIRTRIRPCTRDRTCMIQRTRCPGQGKASDAGAIQCRVSRISWSRIKMARDTEQKRE